MGELLSVRIGAKTRGAVYLIARTTRRTRSEVVREAIEEYVARRAAPETAFDAWKDVIGIAEGLPPKLSERTGEKFRALLDTRRRR